MDYHGGVLRRRALFAQGATKHQIDRAVQEGLVKRLRWGWYAMTDADETVVEAVQRGGVLSCISALKWHGVWVRDLTNKLHIRGNSQAHRKHNGFCTQFGRPEPEDTAVDSVYVALRHAARCMDDESFVAACDSALNQGMISPESLSSAFDKAPPRIHRLIEKCDRLAASGLETIGRLRISKMGVPYRSQVYLPGVGYVDGLVGDRLIIEYDGRQHREDPNQYHTDLDRDFVSVSDDYITVRLTSKHLFDHWPVVDRRLRKIFQAGLHLNRRD
ncbi:hypothetical protein [Gordonia sp. (in: high G+C Gram-positive bacteria)]|uniref:hypothetical protein n=1 Tax=Gordonia sp. (in: high G+C Gram-positive bacteria) TaxID=84139 RepID=UPI003C770D03